MYKLLQIISLSLFIIILLKLLGKILLGSVLEKLHLHVDRTVAAETEPLWQLVVRGTLVAGLEEVGQGDRDIANLVVAESILVDRTNVELVLSRADVEAERLVEDGVQTLGVLGAVLVRLLEPHLDEGIRLAKDILVCQSFGTVKLNIEAALVLGGSNGGIHGVGVVEIDAVLSRRDKREWGNNQRGKSEEFHVCLSVMYVERWLEIY